MEDLKAEIATAEEAVSAAEKVLTEATSEESEIQMKVGDIQALYEEAKGELDKMNERRTHCSAELVGLKNEKADLVKEVETIKLETKKLSLTIARIKKERSAAEKVVTSLMKQHAWIETEKAAFGVRGGDYDFEANNPAEASRHLKELKSEQESLVSQNNSKLLPRVAGPLTLCDPGQEDQQEGHGYDRKG